MIASTWIYSLAHYFVEGWFVDSVNQYYVDFYHMLITISLVFTIFYPLFKAIHQYCCKIDSFIEALVENYMWMAMFIIFFSGLSMHVSWALFCHILSIDIHWGATAKALPLLV